MSFAEYFDARGLSAEFYSNYKVPNHLQTILPADKNATLLDIGCGFGQFLFELKSQGYKNICGVDISNDAIQACIQKGMDVELLGLEKNNSLVEYLKNEKRSFDFISMMHVLEHTSKKEVINLLALIRTKLSAEGFLYLTVPNAQSNTGCYWAYEDWTHETLFTAGSLLYVLKSAGFKKIELIDVDCLSEISSPLKRTLKKVLLRIYDLKVSFWNKVTGSSFHKPSPKVYSYEIKITAR
jgi:2-polyprenyl-3-methyl-5-hydroxy-6-metoxy-1,4-benzoquinol methylase